MKIDRFFRGPVGLILLLGLILGSIILSYLWDEAQWYRTHSFTHECILLNHYRLKKPLYIKNGFNQHILTYNGYTSYETVWDCGKYGTLCSDSTEIFRWARNTSRLLLKKRGDEVRICGIEKPIPEK
jgi:hypothetical protein